MIQEESTTGLLLSRQVRRPDQRVPRGLRRPPRPEHIERFSPLDGVDFGVIEKMVAVF